MVKFKRLARLLNEKIGDSDKLVGSYVITGKKSYLGIAKLIVY